MEITRRTLVAPAVFCLLVVSVPLTAQAVWIRKAPDVRPSPRKCHSMVYDSGRGRVVLYGGQSANITPLADTWEWDGTAWNRKHHGPGPGPRSKYGMAYDTARDSERGLRFATGLGIRNSGMIADAALIRTSEDGSLSFAFQIGYERRPQ